MRKIAINLETQKRNASRSLPVISIISVQNKTEQKISFQNVVWYVQ
jgi:hypothetical protein